MSLEAAILAKLNKTSALTIDEIIAGFTALDAGTTADITTTVMDNMNILTGSGAGMELVAASTTAMNAVAASTTAMNAVIASTTAMNAVAASTTAMNAVAASTTAMNAVAASTTAMNALYAGSTKFSKTNQSWYLGQSSGEGAVVAIKGLLVRATLSNPVYTASPGGSGQGIYIDNVISLFSASHAYPMVSGEVLTQPGLTVFNSTLGLSAYAGIELAYIPL